MSNLVMNFGGRTAAEMRLVLHSDTFVWITRNDWYLPMTQMCESWLPADVFRFIRVKNPGWRDMMVGMGMSEEDIQQLVNLAETREIELAATQSSNAIY